MIRTAFITDTKLAALTGRKIRHQLADGTRVTATINGTRDGYCTAIITHGTHEGRTVRLGDYTRTVR